MILSEARELLFDVVVPTIDSQANVDKFDRCLNLVQERYINSGKFLGMMKEIVVVSVNGYFTLPPRFVSALAVKERRMRMSCSASESLVCLCLSLRGWGRDAGFFRVGILWLCDRDRRGRRIRDFQGQPLRGLLSAFHLRKRG